MKFKKDDIVEVIARECYSGIEYRVGTQLRVRQDQKDHSSVVFVYDSLQKPNGYAMLWSWNLKLIKREGVTEKPKLDLNNLTTAELREYVELVEAKEDAEFLLGCFIEKVTK